MILGPYIIAWTLGSCPSHCQTAMLLNKLGLSISINAYFTLEPVSYFTCFDARIT